MPFALSPQVKPIRASVAAVRGLASEGVGATAPAWVHPRLVAAGLGQTKEHGCATTKSAPTGPAVAGARVVSSQFIPDHVGMADELSYQRVGQPCAAPVVHPEPRGRWLRIRWADVARIGLASDGAVSWTSQRLAGPASAGP